MYEQNNDYLLGEKIYIKDDEYYYWSRYPNITYKNHEKNNDRRVFRAPPEEVEAELIYELNHPNEKRRGKNPYITQEQREEKALTAKMISMILLCCYFIVIPIICAIIQLDITCFVGGVLNLAMTAPFMLPIIIIFITPLVNKFWDWFYDAGPNAKKSNKAMVIGAMTGYMISRRKK